MSHFGSDDKNYGINEIDQSPKVEITPEGLK